MTKYILYATDNNGDGFVQKIGEYFDLYEIDIRVGVFSKDVVINIETEEVKDEK
jgi:hypothetical protein